MPLRSVCAVNRDDIKPRGRRRRWNYADTILVWHAAWRQLKCCYSFCGSSFSKQMNEFTRINKEISESLFIWLLAWLYLLDIYSRERDGDLSLYYYVVVRDLIHIRVVSTAALMRIHFMVGWRLLYNQIYIMALKSIIIQVAYQKCHSIKKKFNIKNNPIIWIDMLKIITCGSHFISYNI